MAGIVILVGHYVDVFNMIMPATVVDRWYFGLPEISALALFLWTVFIDCVLFIVKSTTIS